MTEDRVLFPILHNITIKELRDHRASLANIFARSTTTHTIEEIADEIYEVVQEKSIDEV